MVTLQLSLKRKIYEQSTLPVMTSKGRKHADKPSTSKEKFCRLTERWKGGCQPQRSQIGSKCPQVNVLYQRTTSVGRHFSSNSKEVDKGWAPHLQNCDNWWISMVQWLHGDADSNRGRPTTRRRDQTEKFGCEEWIRASQGRNSCTNMKEAFVLQQT